MNFKDRLKKIDDFFDDMSIEEFDTMIEETGIYNTKPISNYGMEFKLNLANVLEKNKESLYLRQTENYIENDQKFNLYDIDLVKAS